MRIICAPDSFKESLSAAEAAEAMARGVREAEPDAEVDRCPIADGGEGTVDALVNATGGEFRTQRVTGPMGRPVEARWGLLGEVADEPRTAVIEMAAASGLHLVPAEQRDPLRATTFGTGQLIAAALDAGVERIVLGIGGSATNDGGCGAAQALGVRFADRDGRTIDEPLTGGMLSRIGQIDVASRDPRLGKVKLVIACDVTNPLTGPNGAAHVYGPQKGATAAQVEALDAGLGHLADLLEQVDSMDVRDLPGAGAAGGFGAGAMVLLGGTLRRGAELVLQAVGFDRRVRGCDLCLSGEGKIDGQSLSGKAVLSVAMAAAEQGVPTVALVGSTGERLDRVMEAGLKGINVIGTGLSAEESMARAGELLERTAAITVQAHRRK